jgi:glyoxylase-like metal-dependent hydrolase (beta-lactamase superfamily II)
MGWHNRFAFVSSLCAHALLTAVLAFGVGRLPPRSPSPFFVSTTTRHRRVLQKPGDESESIIVDRLSPNGDGGRDTDNGFLEEDEAGNAHIPAGGISVSDEIEAGQEDRFATQVVPIEGLTGVAQLVTTAAHTGSFEPVRYLVALSPRRPPPSESEASANASVGEGRREASASSGDAETNSYAMVDVPPFSPRLVGEIEAFMGPAGRLVAALVTNRDSIHYDAAPAVYATRRADPDLWRRAFPDLRLVTYRLDTPRDCRHAATQVLDGQGPFALEEEIGGNATFVETGRPLTVEEWDRDVAFDVLRGKPVPDDSNGTLVAADEDAKYSPEAIREREEGKRVLAVYTPGHTFGSVSYIFPEQGVCCSGYTIPVEDTREETNVGMDSPGPALDCRGYITTSRAGITAQMQSARKLVNTYSDRFRVVLPARGDPLFVDGQAEKRKELLLGIIEQYERIGEIYEQLGITSDEITD